MHAKKGNYSLKNHTMERKYNDIEKRHQFIFFTK